MLLNPYYPLPADYPSLTRDGKRAARVFAVTNKATPRDNVAGWLFMRNYYLKHTQANWYDRWVEPAPGHVEWADLCARYDRVILGAHRGSAKSTIFSEFSLRDLFVPNYRTLLVNSTLGKVTGSTGRLMRQLETNCRILDDFGKLRPPPRGWGVWNHENLLLTNGAEFKGLSVMSTDLRGERPHRALVDDPEYDSKGKISSERLIEYMDLLLTGILLPMMRAGSLLHWIGTTPNAKSFLYRLLCNEIQDPRFLPSEWVRRLYPGEDGFGTPFWPAENPPEVLERKRRELGARYGPEFLLQPHKTLETPLHISADKHEYRLVDPQDIPPHALPDPLLSIAQIIWNDCRRTENGQVIMSIRKAPAGETFSRLMRFITVDACRAPSPTSDWAVVHVFGVDERNQIWSLDMWAGKVSYGKLCKEIWKLANKWKVRLVGVEAIALEQQLLAEVKETALAFAKAYGWVPQIKAIKYRQGVTKEERIMGLSWRLDAGLWKMPGYRADEEAYRMLRTQFDHFTPGGEGLMHDDHVDTVAMTSEIITSAYVPKEPEPRGTPATVEEYLERGITKIGPIPVICGVDITRIASKTIDKAINQALAGMWDDATDDSVFGRGDEGETHGAF